MEKLEIIQGKLQPIRDFIKSHPILLSSIFFTFWLTSSTYDRLDSAELFINTTSVIYGTLYLGSIYLCVSLGLNMTYKLLGFANFAHAEYFVIGAYTGVAWSVMFEFRETRLSDFFIVLVIAFFVSGFVALLGDLLIFETLRKRQSSPESMMISSIGWGIVLRNIISINFGGESSYFRLPTARDLNNKVKLKIFDFTFIKFETPVELDSELLGSRKEGDPVCVLDFCIRSLDKKYYLRHEYVFVIIITSILVVLLFIFLAKTKTGKAMRATSDNIDLAQSSGINTTRMIRITWIIGGGLAGVAGVLFASTLPVVPYSGFLYLLPAFAVVVLGGVGSLRGSVIASLIIAFSQTLSLSYLSSVWLEEKWDRTGLAAYAPAVPFIVLIGVVLFKPRGLFGEAAEGEE
ncbi:MAG: branched-chain amino acid ABC transporter permease [Candidatus Kariarchaeaceae archaeon]|jgi:branched-subunit amino acid ABC-type transport system permease component